MITLAHIRRTAYIKPKTALCGATLTYEPVPVDTPVCPVCVSRLIAVVTAQSRPRGYTHPIRPLYESAISA
jgi:hypothetical protein